MKAVNPYRLIQAIVAWTFRALVILILVSLLTAMIVGVWQSWGAWALTVPLLIAGGILGMGYVAVLATNIKDIAAERWRKAELEWGRR